MHKLLLMVGMLCTMLTAVNAQSQTGDSRKALIEQMLPENQVRFIAELSGLSREYREALNPLRQYQLREQRSRALRRILPDRKVNDWIGRIVSLGITAKGKAHLGIELSGANGVYVDSSLLPPAPSNDARNTEGNGFSVTFSTWDDRFKDLDDQTLIAPGTPFYELAARFQPGDFVLFTAEGVAEMDHHLKEATADLKSSMHAPRFIFRFEYLEPVIFPEIETSKVDAGPAPAPGRDVASASPVPGDSTTKTVFQPRMHLVPMIAVHFYREYQLSAYDWNYALFMNRWNRGIQHFWKNRPPGDYLAGEHPEGGEVRVYVSVFPEGKRSGIKVIGNGDVSQEMKASVLRAFNSYSLPPLPANFNHAVLKTAFRFQYPPLPHLLFKETTGQLIDTTPEESTNAAEETTTASARIRKRLRRKLLLKKNTSVYHTLIQERLEESFRQLRHFDPSESITVLLQLTHPVSNTTWEVNDEGASPGFRLAVLNGLSQARFPPLPPILKENLPYQVRLHITP